MHYTAGSSTSSGKDSLNQRVPPVKNRCVTSIPSSTTHRFSASSSNSRQRTHNSIDHDLTSTPSLGPSTSGGILDERRELLRRVYGSASAKASTRNNSKLMIKPSSTTLIPLNLNGSIRQRATSAYLRRDEGRSSNQELIEDLRQELHNMKRNYAIILKENSVLKTRLKRCASEATKKDRQLQDALMTQSKTLTGIEEQTSVNCLKQKIIKYESLLKDKSEEINRLKDDREAMKVSDLREHIASLEDECARLKKCLDSAAPLSRKQAHVHREQVNNLSTTVCKLKEENERLASRLANILHHSETSLESLSTCDRSDLIALISRLEMDLRKRDTLRNMRATSGIMNRGAARSFHNTSEQQQVVRLNTELEKARQVITAKSATIQKLRRDLKLNASDNNTKACNTLKRCALAPDGKRNQCGTGGGVKPRNSVDTERRPSKRSTTSDRSTSRQGSDGGTSHTSTHNASTRTEATTSCSSASSSRTESASESETEEPVASSTASTQRNDSTSRADSNDERAEALRQRHAATTIQKQWRHHKEHVEERLDDGGSESEPTTTQMPDASQVSDDVTAFMQQRAAKTIQKQWKSHRRQTEVDADGSGSDAGLDVVETPGEQDEEEDRLDLVINAAYSHFIRLRMLENRASEVDPI